MELRTEWTDLFEEVFDSVRESLPVVLNAAGCREGWLQGEFYRRLIGRNTCFPVNTFPIGPRAKADLCGVKPPRMVAEIKICSLYEFQERNTDGHSVGPYVPEHEGQRVDITPEQVNRAPSGSLLCDLLRSQHLEEDIEKYVILVIDKNGHPDKSGEAIQALRLTHKETTLDYDGFFVRIWQV